MQVKLLDCPKCKIQPNVENAYEHRNILIHKIICHGCGAQTLIDYGGSYDVKIQWNKWVREFNPELYSDEDIEEFKMDRFQKAMLWYYGIGGVVIVGLVVMLMRVK